MRRIFRTRDYRPQADADLGDEIRSHLELKIEDLMAQGMSEEEATAQARRSLSGPVQARGLSRAATHTRKRLRRASFLDRCGVLARDLRYALRRMALSPGFTSVAILSLAIGVGANTAVFTIVNELFLKPPSFKDPAQLVQVGVGLQGGQPPGDARWVEFEALQEVDGTFAGLGAFDGIITSLRDPSGVRPGFVEAMTPDLFPLLGVDPALGRAFLPDEGSDPGGTPVAILGHRYWMTAFGGERSALGRSISIAGIPHTIVGVAPPTVSALQTRALVTDVFVPMDMAPLIAGRPDPDDATPAPPRSVRIVARLAPGVSVEAAEARVTGVVRDVRTAEGRTTRDGWGFRLWSLEGHAIDPSVDAGLMQLAVFLMAVAGLVLLLTCTNLANIFLAKGVSRRAELALRLALGSGRGRLVGQLLAEAVLLSALGGVGGLLLGRAILDTLLRFQPDVGVTFALNTSADPRVLVFTLAVVGVAGLVFGLIPALAVTRSEITPVLKGASEGRRSRHQWLRGGLVAVQMGVSVLLLTGSGLFLRSFLKAHTIDLGFRPEDAVYVQADMGMSNIPPAEWTQLSGAIRRRAASAPGVQAVGVTDALPLLHRNTVSVEIPGRDLPEGSPAPWATRFRVSEGYREAMGIPLLAGRDIQASDRRGTDPVVVVSQAAAQRFWPGELAVGKELVVKQKGHRVVGVVGDVKVQYLSDPPEPTCYFSMAQWGSSELFFVARGSVGTGEMATDLRRAIAEVAPDLQVLLVQSMEDRVGVNLYPVRLAAAYLGALGFMALILAAVGLYGVVSLSVSRRVKEVGIRMSIGADAGSVIAMVLKDTLGPVLVGATIGLGLAAAFANLIRSFLYGVQPLDPLVLGAVPLLLGSVAVAAAFVPARRASRMNPVEALRRE